MMSEYEWVSEYGKIFIPTEDDEYECVLNSSRVKSNTQKLSYAKYIAPQKALSLLFFR